MEVREGEERKGSGRHHVAAMPDVHVGIGATVGSVIPTVSAIIPAGTGREKEGKGGGG